MSDLCDVAQVMWLDRIEQQFLADRALAATLAAAGVQDVDVVVENLGTVDDARDTFLEAIAAPVQRTAADDRTSTILTALGVRRAG